MTGIRRREFVQGLLMAAGGAALGALIPACDPGGDLPAHPYLFFDADRIPALRRKCATSMRPQLEVLQAYAEAHLRDAPPEALRGDYEARGDTLQHPFLTNIL